MRGSKGGQWVAAMQGEINSSSLEHGELGVPPGLSCQPMAPVPSARHVPLCLCSPPFLPAMLPWPEETSLAGKGPLAEPRGAACSALLCMAAPAWLPLVWWCWNGQDGKGHQGTVVLVACPICSGGHLWGIHDSMPCCKGWTVPAPLSCG